MPAAPALRTSERMYSIPEAAELWSVSRDSIERLLARQELRFVWVGERRRIPASALDEYAASRTEQVREE